jgi:hypothetical protein
LGPGGCTGQAGIEPGAGRLRKTASNKPLFLRTFGEVFGNCGRKDMKKKIGHLPTEFIEITPLNSAEFLYSKSK